MSRLAGQVSFWIGFIAIVFGVTSLATNDWQSAPGGVRMGLWQNCAEGSCSNSECP